MGTARKRQKTVLQETLWKCPCWRTNRGKFPEGDRWGLGPGAEKAWILWHRILASATNFEHLSNVLFLFKKNCISHAGVLECVCSRSVCVCVCACVHVCVQGRPSELGLWEEHGALVCLQGHVFTDHIPGARFSSIYFSVSRLVVSNSL